jgi:hypothetical protein
MFPLHMLCHFLYIVQKIVPPIFHTICANITKKHKNILVYSNIYSKMVKNPTRHLSSYDSHEHEQPYPSC